MEENRFIYCPLCASKNIQTLMNGRKWVCPECHLTLYSNVASAVGLVIVNDKDEILFIKRAKEPRKGFLAFPGGFTDADESGEQAAFRECKEETGVCPVSVKYLCSFPNTYVYKEVVYKTCDMFFLAKLPKDFVLNAQQSEVLGFEWVKVQSANDVEKIPLAFDSAKKTLLTYLGEN